MSSEADLERGLAGLDEACCFSAAWGRTYDSQGQIMSLVFRPKSSNPKVFPLGSEADLERGFAGLDEACCFSAARGQARPHSKTVKFLFTVTNLEQ